MNRKVRRIISTLILISTAVSTFAGCANTSKTKLANHMTALEKERSVKTEFQLLNKPWEKEKKEEKDYSYLKDKICFCPKIGAIVHGNLVFNALPEEGYDGGAGQVVCQQYDPSTGEFTYIELTYNDFDDLKAQLRTKYDELIATGYPGDPANEDYNNLISLYKAVIAGEAEIIDQDFLDEYRKYYYSQGGSSDSDSMYWQMDDEKVAAIKDSISEYHLYDEELELGFIVHVTTPKSYDPSKSYPALVMTDAVWRFNDVTSLYDLMLSGKAGPQILITIGFEYDVDGWDNDVRANVLCDHKKEFLDFITDNMMPYLSDSYNFDYSRSTLFGHSQGGVFTHYAAFNFDRYDNKPFANYIIGSPTFWTPYFTCVSDYEDYKNEYGYFERNKTYDRNLFITAGDQEDEDYKEYYGDNDSTLEGVEHLKKRLTAKGVTSFQVKIYSSHHYQYVPEMLVEYVSE